MLLHIWSLAQHLPRRDPCHFCTCWKDSRRLEVANLSGILGWACIHPRQTKLQTRVTRDGGGITNHTACQKKRAHQEALAEDGCPCAVEDGPRKRPRKAGQRPPDPSRCGWRTRTTLEMILRSWLVKQGDEGSPGSMNSAGVDRE